MDTNEMFDVLKSLFFIIPLVFGIGFYLKVESSKKIPLSLNVVIFIFILECILMYCSLWLNILGRGYLELGRLFGFYFLGCNAKPELDNRINEFYRIKNNH